MSILYNVTIESTSKENLFHITWQNSETNTVNSFDQAAEITQEETERLWQWPQCQLDIGQKLFRFLDFLDNLLTFFPIFAKNRYRGII